MDGGKISRDDRWWPARWWRGHWLRHRRTDGEWADGKGGRAAKAHRARQDRIARGPRLTPAQHSAIAYKAYLEARHDSAERAARGTRGGVPRAYFDGRPRSLKGAPEELRDWFAANGRNLTASQFRRQHQESTPGHYPY